MVKTGQLKTGDKLEDELAEDVIEGKAVDRPNEGGKPKKKEAVS